MERKEFEDWLLENKDVTVGETASLESCPLANWLISQGWNDAFVDGTNYSVRQAKSIKGETNKLPDWAEKFVEALDAEDDEGTEISGKEALEILSEIPLTLTTE